MGRTQVVMVAFVSKEVEATSRGFALEIDGSLCNDFR